MKLTSTKEIIGRGVRFNTSSEFFGAFSPSWEGVRCQVLKLETRQTYQEPGVESLEAALRGDWASVPALIQKDRASDDKLYADLRQRGVDFVRCRPLQFPLTPYMRWELQVYRFNSEACERIFCCNREALDAVFDEIAVHDFMVFDARRAFIHDYDEAGLIRGGWSIEILDDIQSLIALHGYVKANSQLFTQFLPDA